MVKRLKLSESKYRKIKEAREIDMDYINFASQLAEDLYEELKEENENDNVSIGKLYSAEYPDFLYFYFNVIPYGASYNDVLTYRVYGDQYTDFLDARLEYVDLEGFFRSAWSDYKINKYGKCVEIGIKFMFNNY